MFEFLSKRRRLMLIIFGLFLIWMIFFDGSSLLNHSKLDKEIKKNKDEIKYSKEEYNKDFKVIEDLKNKDSLEKFAREKYLMKKENEEIILVEFDTIK